jgi:ubiquinone/menaquinone biosynthesis C-methylase UbiE
MSKVDVIAGLGGDRNVDHSVVEDFGNEWRSLDQSHLAEVDKERQFNRYFSLFPWEKLPADAQGFDAGCGSGRWASLAALRVSQLHCVDPSDAIEVAQRNLRHLTNCRFHRCTVGEMPFLDDSMDFGYSLGVLHHIPDTQKGLVDCVKKLKSGAPFLVYLYYAFDNQPWWFQRVWRVSDWLRKFISKLPYRPKYLCSQVIAFFVYYPMARLALVFERMGFSVHSWPLGEYRDKPVYWMRTDALDRFGTKLEHRFTKAQIAQMMENSGLRDVVFSDEAPFHCALGYKK